MSLRRLALLACALGLAGCQQHHHESTAPPAEGQSQPAASSQSEAQRTIEMQRQAEDATRKLQAAQQQELTPEQAEDAYKQFEAERQKLNQQAEGEPSAEPAPPPQ